MPLPDPEIDLCCVSLERPYTDVIQSHLWSAPTSTVGITLKPLGDVFVQCPDHDGFPSNDGPEQNGPIEQRGR